MPLIAALQDTPQAILRKRLQSCTVAVAKVEHADSTSSFAAAPLAGGSSPLEQLRLTGEEPDDSFLLRC